MWVSKNFQKLFTFMLSNTANFPNWTQQNRISFGLKNVFRKKVLEKCFGNYLNHGEAWVIENLLYIMEIINLIKV